MRLPRRRSLDAIFPTVVRYIGIGLIVFYAIGSSFGLQIPESVLIAGTGMILFKTIAGGNGGSDDGGEGGNDGRSL